MKVALSLLLLSLCLVGCKKDVHQFGEPFELKYDETVIVQTEHEK